MGASLTCGRCIRVRLPNGTTAILCGVRLPRPKACITCGDVAELLCDYPVAPGKTCDAPMCSAHARTVGPDRHHCGRHAEVPLPPQQEALEL